MSTPKISSLFLLGLVVLVSPAEAKSISGRVIAVACAPTDHRVAAALSDNAVWITMDQGESWQQVALFSPAPSLEERADEADGAMVTGSSIIDEEEATIDEVGFLVQNHAFDSEGPDDNPVALAVSNNGAWAVWAGGVLYRGGVVRGAPRRREVDRVAGMVMDVAGYLWVGGDNRLRVFVGSGERTVWSLPGSGGPIWDPSGGRVLIPTGDGVWVADSIDAGPRLLFSKKVEAAAVVPSGITIQTGGRIVHQTKAGVVLDRGPSVVGIVGIREDLSGRILLKTRRGTWLERISGSWVTIPIADASVDALGRLWLAKPSGSPVPSRPERAITLPLTATTLAGHMKSAAALRDLDPGPVPCRRWPMNPFPQVRLTTGVGRGSTRATELPQESVEGRTRVWFYAGIRLVWTLGPIVPAECIVLSQRRRVEADRRVKSLSDLWTSWRAAEATTRTARDETEAIDWLMEAERLKELIRLASGVTPQVEEYR